jgi:hypothetical protein
VNSLLDKIRNCLDTLPLMARPFIIIEEIRNNQDIVCKTENFANNYNKAKAP